MRILTVGNRYPPEGFGGYEALWHDNVAYLREHGHEVSVLACDLPAPPGTVEPGVERRLRWYWREHRFPHVPIPVRFALERANQAVLRDVIAHRRPDVIVWFSMGGMSLSLIGAVAAGPVPAVGVVGDEWMLYGPKVDAWTRMWDRLAGRVPPRRVAGVPTRFQPAGAARWIFISAALRDTVQRVTGPLGRTQVAHPGIDRELFAERPAHDWRGDLLFAGRIDPRKGIATAVQALAELEGATLTVDGAGDQEHAAELRALAAELGVADRVRFERSAREDLPARYAAADVVLQPVTWAEPWGLVGLEAMSVGTPVLATGTGGSGEYLRDGENCLLHPPGDAASLAAGVRRLREDPELRARLRAGGLETAEAFRAESFFAAVEQALLEETA